MFVHCNQHSGINFVTPEQRHTGIYIDVLKKRYEVYELVKQKHPELCSIDHCGNLFKNKINLRIFYLKLNKVIMLVLLWEQTRQFQYY